MMFEITNIDQIDQEKPISQEDEALRNLCASIIYRALCDLTIGGSCGKKDQESAQEYILQSDIHDKEAMSLAWCCQLLFDDSWKFHFKLIQKTGLEICLGKKRIKWSKRSSVYKIKLLSTSSNLPSELRLAE